MPCYVLGQITVKDPELYRSYMSGFRKMFGEFDGRLLALDDDPTVLEGSWSGTRVAIIEFVSREEAERWYNSDAYQEITRQFRWPSSEGNVYLVEAMNRKL